MTIKPIINQKSSEKKENHGHNHQETSQQNLAGNSRTNRNKTVEVQSTQIRNDVYEDITRHRRSPHKLSGRSKREHHHKRSNDRNDRNEHDREKICTSPQYVQTQHTNCVNTNQLQLQTTVCNNQQSGKSPKHTTSSTSAALFQHSHQQQQQQQQQTLNKQKQSLINFLEEQYSGYNSGDEHLVPGETLLTPDEWKLRDEKFVKEMSERGFVIQDIVEDGACLFRAISLQIYGDQEMHEVIRQQTMDYIYQNREYFAHFVTEDINSYVKRKRNKDSHGNHIEIQAMSEIYNRPVELYCYGTKPINIFNSDHCNNNYPLRLSYQRGSHYNAIIDPYNASVGVGLGLAGYKPESQTHEAIRLSEQLDIEKTMFEDKLKTTDWEATNEAIEEQIARESYLQWCRENMQKATRNNTNNQNNRSSSQNCTSSTVTSAEIQKMNSTTKNCETTTVTSCVLNECSSSSPPLTKNSDLNCDKDQIINDQQSSLLISKNKKKIDGACNGGGGGISINNSNSNSNSNGKESGNNAILNNECCNSPCDSDDTDISSTSSIDQHCRLKKSPRQNMKSPRRLKRRHRNNELKRNKIEVSGQDFVTAKRSKQCLETLFQQQNRCDKKEINKVNEQTTMTPKTEEKGVRKLVEEKAQNTSNNEPCTSKQADADTKPLSQFYQSLLESSYSDDGFEQMSEKEMLQKAIEMSRMDFIEEQRRKFDKRLDAADEDSDTLST